MQQIRQQILQWCGNRWAAFRLHVRTAGIWADRKLLTPVLKQIARWIELRLSKDSDTPQVPEWKQNCLTDFEHWLRELPETETPETVVPDACDLFTLLSEFAGLRTEIKMQNREQIRAVKAIENFMTDHNQAAELFRSRTSDLAKLESSIRGTAERKTVTPFLDVRDAILRALAAAETPASGKKGWFRKSADMTPVIEGYRMILTRMDQALAASGVRPVETDGKRFDPACMNAIHVQAREDAEPGIVIETVRGAFSRGDVIIRYADVIVSE